MLTKGYCVSVLIRTKDIERHLPELLWRLSRQTLQPLELVVVDNFSSKSKLKEMVNLLSLVKRKLFENHIHVKLVPLTDKEFSHAYSTNVGVFVATCDLVCITNGHSLPASREWLESGVVHFKSLTVAGVGGYFTSHEDGTVWEKIAYDWGWKKLNELSRTYVKDNYFSTVNCVLRRSLWEEFPFDEKLPDKIPHARKFGGEDYDWAREMLARGYKIVVEPKFNVYHSHRETLSQLVPKYLIWRQIRRNIRSLRRPRKSYTKLRGIKPLHYNL